MLQITVPSQEFYDERTNEFIETKEQVLRLEHSLVSVSKWEAKYNKPFLGNGPKQKDRTEEEMLDYIRFMTITQNVDPMIYQALTKENMEEISNYISAPMTATWFNDKNGPRSREVITSELIYYWMISQNIPFECQKWHLNRLLTLIKVCGIKNAPPKKMGKAATMAKNHNLNMQRLKSMGTTG